MDARAHSTSVSPKSFPTTAHPRIVKVHFIVILPLRGLEEPGALCFAIRAYIIIFLAGCTGAQRTCAEAAFLVHQVMKEGFKEWHEFIMFLYRYTSNERMVLILE